MIALKRFRSTPPRFVARTMVATFATVGLILVAVFVVMTLAENPTLKAAMDTYHEELHPNRVTRAANSSKRLIDRSTTW